MKRTNLKDAEGYAPSRARLIAILDFEDCSELMLGIELEPIDIASAEDEGVVTNAVEVKGREGLIKDFIKRKKRAVELITERLDDSIVITVDELDRDPVRMWEQLGHAYDSITAAKKLSARKDFFDFRLRKGRAFLR